jgi:hypothetical protein
MLRLFFYLLAAALVWHVAAVSSHGQLVQVGPGYVKAPFVRVYWYPDGSSYVRAPFVSIYSGGHYYPHGYHSDGGHDVDQFGSMDWRSLNQAIREWRSKLDANLLQNPSGDFWKTSLKTAEIATLVSADWEGPPNEEARQQLRAIYDTFEKVASSPEVNGVAGLQSFQMLRAALREYSTPAEPRARGQLAVAAHDLSRSLKRFETGPAWQQYLLLAPGMVLAKEKLEAGDSEQSIGELTRAAEIYDSVRDDGQYRIIAELPAFSMTRNFLAAYLQQLQASPSSSPQPAPREELPQPRS